MKSARKMILLDYSEAKRMGCENSGKMFDLETPRDLKGQQFENLGILKDFETAQQLTGLDQEILGVLNDKTLSDYEKIKLYNDRLHKFMIVQSNAVKRQKREHANTLEHLIENVSKKIEEKAQESYRKTSPSQKYKAEDTSTPKTRFTQETVRKGVLTKLLQKYAEKDSEDLKESDEDVEESRPKVVEEDKRDWSMVVKRRSLKKKKDSPLQRYREKQLFEPSDDEKSENADLFVTPMRFKSGSGAIRHWNKI